MGRFGIGIIDTRKVDHNTDGVMTAFVLRKLVVFAADNGYAVRPDARTMNMTVLDEDMNAADAEYVTRGIQFTSANAQIRDIDTRDAVVVRVENTAVDESIVAVVQMNAVRAADAGDIRHRGMIALVELMHEVIRVY